MIQKWMFFKCIRAVYSAFAGHSLWSQGSNASSGGQWIFWSDCADAQADLSLRWAQMQYGPGSNEPAYHKTYDKTCATSEDSDQTAHLRSLIWVFADRICLLQPPAVQRGINENSCHAGRMYWLILICASHTGLIVGFVVRYQITIMSIPW